MIFDAHLDLAWNACEWNRDLCLPVHEIREQERESGHLVTGDCTVSWHDLNRGGIRLVIGTLLPRLNRANSVLTRFNSPEAAYASAKGQLAYYRAMEQRGVIRLIRDARSLQDHLDSLVNTQGASPIGVILSMEGSDPILSPGQLVEWYEDGLRLLGPAHFGESPYCFGTGSVGGLKSEGKELLRVMEELGMILDVTHLCDRSLFEALESFHGAVIASHHNCRAIAPGERQLSDEQIRWLIERRAVIGASFDCWMIKEGFETGTSSPLSVCMDDVAVHVDHICQLAGNADHCGIGSDLDGGHGKESVPHDLDTVADLGNFSTCLHSRGLATDQVSQIMIGNFTRLIRAHWERSEPLAENDVVETESAMIYQR